MKLTSIHDSRLSIYKKMGVPKGKNSYPDAGALEGPQFLVDGSHHKDAQLCIFAIMLSLSVNLMG